jgi:hypothetical protein
MTGFRERAKINCYLCGGTGMCQWGRLDTLTVLTCGNCAGSGWIMAPKSAVKRTETASEPFRDRKRPNFIFESPPSLRPSNVALSRKLDGKGRVDASRTDWTSSPSSSG